MRMILTVSDFAPAISCRISRCRHFSPCGLLPNQPEFTPHVRKPPNRTRTVPMAKGATTSTTAANNSSGPNALNRSHETDVVVIGSGIGGLCCAALLAYYGYRVTVCEAHYHAGGAAHGFDIAGYKFDAGPSFFAGISGGPETRSANPLKQLLDVLGESLDCATYNRWMVYDPEGSVFPCVCDGSRYRSLIRQRGGETAYKEWLALEAAMAPLQQGAALFPAAALRADPGIVLTAARFGPALLKTAFLVNDLTGPFSNIVDRHVTDPWLRNFIDLECFVLSGMLAKDTIAAEMAFMFMERNSGNSTIDYPIGGSEAIVAALVRAIERRGGKIMLRCKVDRILLEGGKATGVALQQRPATKKAGMQPELIRARRAVVSNASVWDTCALLNKEEDVPQSFLRDSMATPRTGSFMHLHLGIDATDLPKDLDCHHLFVNSWNELESPQNVCIASIPTVFDPNLAPPGKAVIHAYTAGNEPWEGVWDRVTPGTPHYEDLKEERAKPLWTALEKIVPDIKQRTEVRLIGTPHTHRRFLNRHKGTYGAAISAAHGSFPGPSTPIQGLYRCGDSCAPGIGVPAAAASGVIAANTLAPVWSHLGLLNEMRL